MAITDHGVQICGIIVTSHGVYDDMLSGSVVLLIIVDERIHGTSVWA